MSTATLFDRVLSCRQFFRVNEWITQFGAVHQTAEALRKRSAQPWVNMFRNQFRDDPNPFAGKPWASMYIVGRTTMYSVGRTTFIVLHNIVYTVAHYFVRCWTYVCVQC